MIGQFIFQQDKEQALARRVFDALDTHKDGELDADEFINEFSHKFNLRLGEADMNKMVKNADIGGDGKIQFSEFMAASSDKEKLLTEANLKKTFSYFDVGQDGKVDYFDVKDVLRLTPENTELEKSDFRVDFYRIYNQI